MTDRVKQAFPPWLRRMHAPRQFVTRHGLKLNVAAMIGLAPYFAADRYAEAFPSPAATLLDSGVNFVWTLLFLAAVWCSLSLNYYRLRDMDDELEKTIAARRAYEAAVAEAIGQLITFEPEEAAPAGPSVH